MPHRIDVVVCVGPHGPPDRVLLVILHRPAEGWTVEYDICIIGSGPAGLALANELRRLGRVGRICVLESGRREKTPFADSLRRIEMSGIGIREDSRERVLGGTSVTWAGLSALLDPIDFEVRSWVRYSGWPIERADLLRYYKLAATFFQFPDLSHFIEESWKETFSAGDFAPEWRRLSRKLFLARTEPQRFGRDHLGVFDSELADLRLDATAVRLEGEPESRLVTTAVARSSDQAEFRVKARRFVLACGGIENARLLLASSFCGPAGLGNEHDQVGRYLMNHPKGDSGYIQLARPLRELPAYFGFLYRGFSGYVGLRLDERLQREQRVLNSYVRFEPIYSWSHDEGVAVLVDYLKRSGPFFRAFQRMRRKEVIPLRDYAETGDSERSARDSSLPMNHLKRARLIWRHRAKVAQYLWHRLTRRRPPFVGSIVLRNFMEMEPAPDNRVTLSTRLDPLGARLAMVHHRVSPIDRATMVLLHSALRAELEESGWGRLVTGLQAEADPWPINSDASHHLGTTRMGSDPQTSVVNADCRLHTVANVYVAGGSVFPTSGNANPTFTVVALSMRLAEHLSDRDLQLG